MVDAAVPVDVVLPDADATEEPLVPEEPELELLDPVALDLVELEPEVSESFFVLEVEFELEELEPVVVFESSLYVLLKVALLYDALAERLPLLLSVTVTVTLAEWVSYVTPAFLSFTSVMV